MGKEYYQTSPKICLGLILQKGLGDIWSGILGNLRCVLHVCHCCWNVNKGAGLDGCYVGQYTSMSIKSHIYMFVCLGVIILRFIVCSVIHNCSSSGSLFFTTLRQNN